MKNQKFKKDWLPIIIIGLLIQLFWAWRLTHPSYMDAYYYTVSGQRLADGFGFTVPVVWQFLDGLRELPALSHTYWMPLPSIIASIGYLFGDGFRYAQAPFWLMAGLLPWLAFMISAQLTGQRWQAWSAGIFTAAGGYYAAYLSQPTTFAPFAWAGGLGLLYLAHATNNQQPATNNQHRFWLFAGIFAGLAHLTRADGILFLLLGGGLWAWYALQQRKFTFKPILYLAIGYFMVMLPWFIHNSIVMGRPMSVAGTQTIFLTTYNDIFSYGRTFGLSDYLAWGWGNIIQSKLQALWLTIQTFIAVLGLVFLAPFVLVGWVHFSKNAITKRFIRPLTWYTLGLFGLMVFVFTFPAGRGSVLHSSAAIWAWMMPLAVAGLGVTVDWVATRLPHWQPERAKPLFALMFGMVVLLVSPIVSGTQPLRQDEGVLLSEIGETLPANARVMGGNPPMVFYHTGMPAITLPNEPLDVILQAANDFQITHLLLDIDHPDTLNPLWENSSDNEHFEHLGDYRLADAEETLMRCQELRGEQMTEEQCPLYRLYAIQP